jgi:hypothetical protein
VKTIPQTRWPDQPFYKLCLAFYGLSLPLTFACVSLGVGEGTSYAPDWLAVFGPLLWFVKPVLVALIVSNAAVLVIGFLIHTSSSRITRSCVVALRDSAFATMQDRPASRQYDCALIALNDMCPF